jgi:hypothetical protein
LVSGTERGAASAHAEVSAPAQPTAQERAAYETMEGLVWDLRQRWSIDIVQVAPTEPLRPALAEFPPYDFEAARLYATGLLTTFIGQDVGLPTPHRTIREVLEPLLEAADARADIAVVRQVVHGCRLVRELDRYDHTPPSVVDRVSHRAAVVPREPLVDVAGGPNVVARRIAFAPEDVDESAPDTAH